MTRSKLSHNRILYFLITIIYATGFMFCSGTVLQTFLLTVGLSEQDVYVYNAVIQAVQTVVILAMAFLADKLKHVMKLYASIVMSVTLIAVSLILCVFLRTDAVAVKALVFASSVIVYFLIGVRNAVDYRILYEILDMDTVGKLMGTAIAVSGLVSFGASALYSYAIKKFDYYDVMTVFFIASAALLLISSLLCFSYKKVNDMPESEKKRGLDLSTFKSRTTRELAVPSLFRGFANGIIVLITVVGISSGIVTTQTSSYISIITQAATFLGNIAFAVICKRMSNKTSLLLSSVIMAVAMPVAIMHGNITEFLIAYALAYFAYMIVSIAVPMLVCEIVPYEQIGSFTCIRMMLFTFGSVIASLVYKPLADSIGYFWLFVIAGALQIVCGAAHYLTAVRVKREERQKKEEQQRLEEPQTPNNTDM